jgi:hypothetical protein
MALSSRGRSNGPVKRRGSPPVPEETLERLQRVEERLSTVEKASSRAHKGICSLKKAH